ncbi:hypothetical protein EJB05_57331, partial [Eragrostis curvula]
MSGLQTASAIAQVAGVDAFSLITLIVRAANTASQNKKTCRQLAKQVEQIRELLQSLENQPGIAITKRPETSAPLLELHETLQRARTLVESCQKGGYARQLCAGGARAANLRDVQGRIDSFLRLFPIISHLDSTRLLVQVINSAANFSFSQLMTATDNFSFENLMEQGPLATLYKGHLCGNDVTIRKLSLSSSGQQLPQSISGYQLFKNEVMILPKLQHKNIVKLMGFCAERSERILAYEYMQNGMRMKGGPTVEWPTRFRIVEGVAEGAIYLHNHSRQRIIHRDLKPSNVLLDSDMNPRIFNFDVSKVVSEDSDQGTADCVAFKKTLWRGVKLKQRLKGFIHPSLHSVSFIGRIVPRCLSLPARRTTLSQQKEMRRCIRVALLCIQQNPDRRPDMLEAARMLRPRKASVPFPHRPGYARESPMYAGDRS